MSKGNRLRARKKPERLSEQNLINGWSDTAGVRIRQARATDLPAITELVPLAAGVRLEDVLRDAVTADIAGAALRSGLRGGAGAFHRYLAEQFARHLDDPLQAYLHAALVLVAEHRDRGIIGTLIAYPPINVAEDHLQLIPARADRREVQKVVLLGAIGLAKIKAVAVAETERRRGIGAALLKRCRQVYVHCGYLLLYGAMPPTPGWSAFYRRQGFDVMEAGAPMDMWMVFGVHSTFLPGAGERFFFRRFQPSH
ncbi:GNAT family N-acetyltransferase [Nonomuraea sp. KC401]|uniref:GNAT family N-acetyltransferase n=1 Tax=unclassified Nonomuraea TaxID=2593643 RepID=UPI0010FCF55B|nr:GNAT family N-acetyltransferase [Nonomuraea sp. KC401]NBE98111.1 GNAT family N-acetyltransferase [Nonomuraea sp. K271]TLF60417.1 GNAT family N-acetyltransferase [Nonomuraea sp. KC401]